MLSPGAWGGPEAPSPRLRLRAGRIHLPDSIHHGHVQSCGQRTHDRPADHQHSAGELNFAAKSARLLGRWPEETKQAFLLAGACRAFFCHLGLACQVGAANAESQRAAKEGVSMHYAIQIQPPRADTRRIRRKWLDIPYADRSPSQKLDIYLPDAGDGPFPVIVSLHGGAFMGCDKADLQILPMLKGLKRGYAVVGVNYRLSGEAIFPALVQDVKAAIRWIRAHAAAHQLDGRWIAAWGSSAGGYLALMLGTSAGISELDDLSLGNAEQPANVQAVVAWYPPVDFLAMDEQLEAAGLPLPEGQAHNGANSPESLLLGAKITEIPERVGVADPVTYIRAGAPPFLMQHGTRDPVVPAQQSVNLAASLRAVLGAERVTLELIEGAEHADPKFETRENVSRVLDFLDQHRTSAETSGALR
jgi:acetyl esterase/lipase